MKLNCLKSVFAKKRRVTRGFTLVELVIVLVLITILASVGIVTVFGYIKQSKFNKNEQNAITIYQTSQTAMSQMVSAGTMDRWIRDIIDDDTIDHVTAPDPIDDPEANEAVGKTVYLTFNQKKLDENGNLVFPNRESEVVYDLLSGYFYDQSIFTGTISIEFYISMTYDANKVPYYSARVISAFFSFENTAEEGWDDKCLNGSTDGLPDRDPDNRYNITHVGYYDGTEASAKPQVVSVFLPRSQTKVLDGHIIGPTDDPNANAEGYLFNLRNGETLDVSWAMFDEDGNLHSDFDRNENLTITLHDAGVGNAASFKDVVLTIGPDTLDDVRFGKLSNQGSTPEIVAEKINDYIITRTSYDSTVRIKVKRDNTENEFVFPITVTKVEGDGRKGCPVDANGSPVAYIEYRLSLDCMMIRSDETQEKNIFRYNSERLFSNNIWKLVPRNIYASIVGYFDYTNDLNHSAKRDVPLTYAARAMDDPVYFTGMSGTTYVYDLPNRDVEGKTVNDERNKNNEDTGMRITGKCIVNTLFGDAYYNDSIGGTSWSSSGGNAVITSYRHLYNIRWIDSAKTANYRIIRNLDWYVHNGNSYVSEVKVYMASNRSDRADYGYDGVRYRSPAKNNNLYVVSFPAICKLGANQTISSMSVANGTTYAINNVQMRTASFRSGDSGYGLICTSYGTLYNLYLNNLNIILANVKDGSVSDYSLTSDNFNPNNTVSISTGGISLLDNYNVGGLVGYNKGLVGKADLDETENVIRMNNCIVMGGNYWQLANYKKNSSDPADYSTGGVIGYNEGKSGNQSTYGIIEMRGAFVVVGGGANVGGIIGRNNAETSARLITSGDKVKGTTCEYSLPSESNTNSSLSCVVAGQGNVGGAIGRFENHALNYSVGHEFSKEEITYDPVTGQPRFPNGNDKDYQIDVTIPEQGLVLKLPHLTNNDDTSPVGGAIGNWNACNGSYASIRVRNSGNVISADTTRKIACGAAVGEDVNCSTSNVFIDVINKEGSRIGSVVDTSGPRRVGGAYGYIGSTAKDRTIAINICNDGHIVAKGIGNNEGAGGAIGATSGKVKINFIIKAVNNSDSLIKDLGGSLENGSGTGGVIGIMGYDDTTELTGDSVLYAENHGSIAGQCRVGGVLGNAARTADKSKIFAVNYGTISGTYYVGGAVGRHVYNHYGTIQSILESGCSISGANFVGGAAGRISYFNDNAVITTIVRGNSIVDGGDIGSVVGGICGDLRIVDSGIGGTIKLIGYSSDPILTVNGKNGIGGAVGVMRSEVVNKSNIVTPDQSSTDKLTVHINGVDHVGGVVGCLRASNNNFDENVPANLFEKNALTIEILTTISIKLNPKSFVNGTGENVGGAVGSINGSFNNGNFTKFGGVISVSTASGSSSDSAYIRGKRYVGGAVGHFNSVVPTLSNSIANGCITADFSSASWKIEATIATGNEADVGGVVGYFQGDSGDKSKTYGTNDNSFPITVNLGASTVTSAGYNVGGVIGRNQVRNGIITSNNISGTVSGYYNVGGAIGSNENRVTEVAATILATGVINANGSNSITNSRKDGSKGDGSNVGGAIGYYVFVRSNNLDNNSPAAITGKITANVSGTVEGTSHNVAGAVGYCCSNQNRHLIRNVSVVLQGAAVIHGADNVGGTIGFSQSNITNVKSDISGTSCIEGNYHVGGAIGWTYALEQQTGNNVFSQNPESLNPDDLGIADLETKLLNSLYKASGRIADIVATVSADYALQGVASIGGAVGQSGYKSNVGNNGNTYASPALINVKAVINTGYLFDPFETGIGLNELNPIDKPKENVQGAYGNACIGGVIGLVVDGRINSVELNGTGGTVNTDSSYPCPEISMSGAVLIAAKGHSIGGVIGQIGLLGYGKNIGQTDGGAQNVTVSKISASDTLGICVVSMNDANNIGGWIGSGYGVFGGIGNRAYNDYKNTNTRSIYNVNNIKFIYSKGNNIGGFCGYSRGYRKFSLDKDHPETGNQPGLVTWADINVVLKDATICGSTAVGGAFGCIEGVKFAWGCINVDLKDHSVIGDPSGSHICEEAGGAIGYLRNETEGFGIPVTVKIDSSSRIWADGGTAESSNTYGVGGVLGRCSGVFGRLKFNIGDDSIKNFYDCAGTLTVISESSTNVSVYSRFSNVGGVVGVMDKVNMSGYQFNATNATANYYSYARGVTVQANGDNACVGGFVGRINSLSANMYNCYSNGTGTVYANGTAACAGGFVGYATLNSDSFIINSCYTTSEVKSSAGEYTGGFAGRMLRGTISNCYVGGHTYQGSYVAGEGNVSGKGNVGGFVGATTGSNSVTIDNCYSTASVLGSADNIGGFIGSASTKTTVKNCYSTGKIVCPNTLTSGTFVGNTGNAAAGNYTNNKVLRNAYAGNPPLLGESCTSDISSANIGYANSDEIRGSRSDTAHPFDTILPVTYDLRAVIGTDHYGDWPLPVTDKSIDNAEVRIYVQTGVNEQDEPIFEWVDFENDIYEYVFNGTMVVLDETKLKLFVLGEEVPRENYLIYYRDNSKVGKATITFAAKSDSDYSGAISRTFKITAANIEGINAEFKETSHEYTGARIIPGLTVKYENATLVYGTDYTLAYDRNGEIEEGFDNDNINIGVMNVYIIGKGNYSGTKLIGQYEITTIDLGNLTDENISLIGADNLVYDEVDGVPVEHRPGVAVRYNGNPIEGTTDPEAEGFDYVISYENNDKAGTAYLVITGTADESIGTGSVYTGVKKVEFTISPAVNIWTEDPAIEGWIYGETPNAPTGSVKFGEIDYKFYSDSNCTNPIADISAVNVGRYYVQVFAKENSNYTGPTADILSFTISPKNISGASVTIDPDEYPYNGSPISINKSDISVTIGEGESAFKLEQDDFTISSYDPSEHTEPGIVTFTIAGAGNYEGTAEGTFTIYREYEVKFISDGQVYKTETVRAGDSVSKPDQPAAVTGYKFGGWYSDSACTEEYEFSDPVTDDLKLYAKWIRVNYIRYNTGDPEVVMDENPQEVVYDTYPDRPADPIRTGYEFAGWYRNSSFTGDPYKFDTKVFSDFDLYAKWIPVYTISFNTGEGTAIDSQIIHENEFVIVPAVPPEWEGHSFAGWYKDDKYTELYDFTEPVKNSFDLYAKWEDELDGG